MADINMTFTLSGNLKEQQAQADVFLKTMQNIQRTAKDTKAVSSAPKSVSAAVDPGLSRGTTGSGGVNDSKDFARQAQGLGGLVHVYATFAANIFAITAAFTALKKAADYTNMVEGLNQLGAASGKNLGTVAKNLVETTDYAVSLRNAMEATAQATSAGLNTDQISKLGEVAKKASQALGRDVGDSLSRLSRGISKIEPELLDELGIMVRVDKAAQNYALTLGKTATSLTEFERRQSFAIAVLEQGEKKFGRINIDSNPYSKLEATFSNLAIKGGTLLNTVLGPIAKYLSESPTAFGTVLAGFTGLLLSKAIPALSQWRTNLVDSAKAAADTASRLAQAHQDFKINQDIISANASAEPLRRQALDSLAGVQTALGKALPKTSKLLKDAMSEGFAPDADRIVKYEKELTRSSNELAKVETERNSGMYKGNQAVLDSLDKQIIKGKERVANLTLAVDRSREYLKAEEAIANTYDKAGKDPSYLSGEASRQRIADAAERKSNRLDVISKVSENVKVMGILGAIEKLDADIAEKSGKINKNLAKVQGRAIASIVGITTFMSSLGNAFAYAAIAMAAFAVADGIFSKNARQVENFNKSVDTAEESVMNLKRSLEFIRDSKDLLSTENVLAFATAMNGVAESMYDIVLKFKEVKREASGWDNFKNGIADIFNADVERGLAVSMANSLKRVEAGITKQSDREALSKLLTEAGIQDASFSGIKSYIDTLANEGNTTAIEKLAKGVKDLTKGFANNASNLQAFANATTASEKAMQTLMNSFLPSDNFSKFGLTQIDQSLSLAKAVEEPTQAIVALSEVVEDLNKLSLMPESMRTELLAAKPQIAELNASLKAYDAAIVEHQSTLASLEASGDKYYNKQAGQETPEKTYKYKQAEQNIADLEKYKTIAVGDIAKYTELGRRLASELYDVGAKKLTAALSRAMEESAIGIKKALTSGIGGVEGAVLSTKLDNDAIKVQLSLVNTQEGLIVETAKLRLAFEAESLGRKLDNESKKDNKDTDLIAKLQKSLVANSIAQNILQSNKGSGLVKAITSEQNIEAKLQVGDVASKVQGVQIEKTKLSGQIQQNIDKGNLNIIKEKWKVVSDINTSQIESNNIALSALDAQTSTTGLYNKELEFKKLALLTSNDQLLIDNERIKLSEIETTNAYRLARLKKGSAEYNLVDSAATNEKRIQEKNIQKKIDQASVNSILNENKRITKEYEGQKANLDLISNVYTNVSDLASGYNNILVGAGRITESEAINMQKNFDLQKQQFQFSSDLLAINEKIAKARNNKEDTQLLEAQRYSLEQINNLKKESITLQARYNEALVKTEDTMRSIEKGGNGNFDKYMGAMADNFSDKLTAMIKAAKSAGDTFNQGLITAIDTGIDELAKAVQTSTLTLKSSIKYVRNALSDVFRDSAAQILKNAWKDVMKGVMGKTQADKALDATMESRDYLSRIAAATEALANTGLGISGEYTNGGEIDQTTSMMKKAGETNLKTADSTQIAFGTMFDKLSGMLGPFGFLIKGLGGTIMSVISQLSFAGAMQGASQGPGLFGTVGGFFKGLFGGSASNASGGMAGVGSMLAGTELPFIDAIGAFVAKGDTFSGSQSLSRYSNSIVESPTMFAYAKGGVPTNAGVMGEAGPEAIMPLRRDSRGNLGVSGASGNNNNITIIVNVENGNVSAESDGITESMAGKLGESIKAVVSQEILKQTRPGGILAR